MGMLVDGRWDANATRVPDKDGRSARQDRACRRGFTADGLSGVRVEPARSPRGPAQEFFHKTRSAPHDRARFG